MSSLTLLLATALAASVVGQQTINDNDCRKELKRAYATLAYDITLECEPAGGGDNYEPMCADGWLMDRVNDNNQCYKLSGIKTRVTKHAACLIF